MKTSANPAVTRLSPRQIDFVEQALDPTTHIADLREALETWSEPRFRHLPLPPDGYAPEDIEELVGLPTLAPYYDASSIEAIFQEMAGQGLELAALANPSLDLKYYLAWSKHPRPKTKYPRLRGERVFWRCNPKAASPEAIAIVIDDVNQLRRTSLSVLIRRFFLDIGTTLISHVEGDGEILYPAACEVFAALTPPGDDRELVIESGFLQSIEAQDIAGWIEHLFFAQMNAGCGELECVALVADAAATIASKVDMPDFSHLFDRIL